MFLVALVGILSVSGLVGCQGKGLFSTRPPVPVRAVYYYQGHPELSLQDVRAHPEIIVVHTFDAFKQAASQKVALWIDNSVDFDDQQAEWMREAPQTYYPIVVVGNSVPNHAFGNLGFPFTWGPVPDGTPTPLGPGLETIPSTPDAPGFSVFQYAKSNDLSWKNVLFLNGYDQPPTVQAILDITNALLDGKLIATAVPTLYFKVATPTAFMP
jgi:hypothetical protein